MSVGTIINVVVGVGVLAFIVLRCLALPEQPWIKWLVPGGIVAAGVFGYLSLLIPLCLALAAMLFAAGWDFFWRVHNDYDVFW